MKIGIQTYGSRGDINPWIALGQGFCEQGHEVVLYYTNYTGGDFSHHSDDNFKVVSSRTLAPDSGAYEKVSAKKIYDLDIEDLTDYMVKEVFDLFEREMILAGQKLCAYADVIINNPNLYHTSCLAEKYAVPRVNILVECQFSPSNKVSQYNDVHINSYFLERINGYRQELDLELISNVRAEVFNSSWLNLLAYSRVFTTDEASWGEAYQYCGYLKLDTGTPWTIPDELSTFIRSGNAPVFFSMGSLAFFEGKNYDILDTFLEAIEMSGCRAIIQADWDNFERKLPRDNKNIQTISFIPHDDILPLCSGVVHHGGAGTSHTALLNECPSIVIAYAWDQFYWGRELQRLGASVGTLKRRSIDALQLAGMLRQLIKDDDYKHNVVSVKRAMKRENGVARASKLILQKASGIARIEEDSRPNEST